MRLNVSVVTKPPGGGQEQPVTDPGEAAAAVALCLGTEPASVTDATPDDYADDSWWVDVDGRSIAHLWQGLYVDVAAGGYRVTAQRPEAT